MSDFRHMERRLTIHERYALLLSEIAGRSMDIEGIKAKIRANEYVYTHHAEIERRADELTFAQVEEALLNGEMLEEYPDTGRGESCLVVGFAKDVPIHAVCGWRGEKIALITVYIPCPPKFIDPWTRGEKTDAENSMQFLWQ